jgi:DNA-binding MarR family transcriptional regulator
MKTEDVIALNQTLHKASMSLSTYAVLLAIAESPKSMTEVSKLAGVSTAASTGIADKLERAGYVQRSYSKHSKDRRKIYLVIKGAGLKFIEKTN